MARLGSGEGALCWKCMRKFVRWGDLVMWASRSLTKCVGNSYGARRVGMEDAAVEGEVVARVAVEVRVAW